MASKIILQVNFCQKLLFLHQLTIWRQIVQWKQVQYMKILSSNLGRTWCVQKLFLTFRKLFVHNMISPCFVKRRASDEDLPVQHGRVTNWKKSAEAKSQQRLLLIRVSMVVTIHNNVLTQWHPLRYTYQCIGTIAMGQFGANIFWYKVQTTSYYLWGSKVFKNLNFKSQIFSSSQRKQCSKLILWVN